MKHKILRYFLLFTLTCAACAALIFYQLKAIPISYVQDKPSTGVPDIGGPFTLTDQYGQKRSSNEFKGKLMLIYFGYSFCPDVCPTGLQNITGALNLLKRDRERVVPIFITIDPNRDTSEHLKLYATNFDPNFIMLTGSEQDIKEAAKLYRVYAQRSEEASGPSDYLIDHSTLIYLIDDAGNFQEHFPHSLTPDKLSQEIQRHLLPK